MVNLKVNNWPGLAFIGGYILYFTFLMSCTTVAKRGYIYLNNCMSRVILGTELRLFFVRFSLGDDGGDG